MNKEDLVEWKQEQINFAQREWPDHSEVLEITEEDFVIRLKQGEWTVDRQVRFTNRILN